MKNYLFYLAVIGWLISVTAHLLSLAHIDVADSFPFIWGLHLLVFVVWIPTIIILVKNKELLSTLHSGKMNILNPIAFFKLIFKQSPKWLTIIAIVGFVYANINFILFMGSQHGTPDIRDGQYILENHGQLIRNLTAEEYHAYKADILRGFSGHWILFYGLAAAVLYPFSKDSKTV